MIKNVIKRDGSKVPYEKGKIIIAISKANKEVHGRDKISRMGINEITKYIETLDKTTMNIEQIQNIIEFKLMEMDKFELAKKYIIYRANREIVRYANTTDESILKLVQGKNKELAEENSNKNVMLLSTQRDYIAGEASKDLTDRILLPERIVKAHKDAILHFHDKDYFLQKGMFNCCLVNIGDILNNGTVMNGKMVESPKSFRVACTVMTQVVAAVASNQYGGQSVDIRHLGKFLRLSYEKQYNRLQKKYCKMFYKKYFDKWSDKFEEKRELFREFLTELMNDFARAEAEDLMLIELKDGIQTIQYQINTLMTTNGQSPFLTLFMYLRDDDPYIKENAMIIEEILRQRTDGIKNEEGILVTPAFPKLVYVLDENNCFKGGEYDYLTKKAIQCNAKRMYPDYISAKRMKMNYEGNVFSCMGCRSFLSPWLDESGEYKWEGRFNQGVVSLNLTQIGIIANGDMDLFWKLMDERLELCYEALMCRHKSLLGTLSDVSPIHWQYGAIARLKKGEKIDKYLKDGYSTISLGYIGVYEMTLAMLGQSHTTPEGTAFALKVMNYLKDTCEKWKKETGLGFGLYGTPAESLCYRFAAIDRETFGDIEGITDKGFYTNSFHVYVGEEISAFDKLIFESQFQTISTGGTISYVEVPNLQNNLESLESVVKFIYDNIQYAEFNTKCDYCHECGYDGEILLNDNFEWECPCCHNKDKKKLTVVRRTCGYLGENYWNEGKTKEIKDRVMHL